MNKVDEINKFFEDRTFVRRLDISVDLVNGDSVAYLELVDDSLQPTLAIKIRANCISEMSLRGLGGGLTQVQCLHVKDISELQHENVNFIFEDLEEGVLSFKCKSFVTWFGDKNHS